MDLKNTSDRAVSGNLRMPQVPVEWFDRASWRLPSGKALAEFALQSGFLAPLLFKVEGIRTPRPFQQGTPEQLRKEGNR